MTPEGNPKVREAQKRLAALLAERGANIGSVTLPPGSKLDDFLKARNGAAYRKLRRTSLGWEPPALVTYGKGFSATEIPQRQWVIEGEYALGEGTAIVGPPGTNKSTKLLTDAVSIATGQSLLGAKVVKPGEVLLLVGEDSRRDVEARLAAILERNEIPPAKLADRLHVTYQSELDPGYTLAAMERDVAVLNERMLDWLRERPNLVAVFIDPVSAWHRLIEVDNRALQMLCTAFRRIAAQGHRALAFDHHVNKASMTDPEAHVGNLASVRGGTVLAADMRWGFTLARLRADTAKAYAIPDDERPRFRRLDQLKASYGADDGEPRLLKVESVLIGNGESVGVLTLVDAQAMRDAGADKRIADELKQRQVAAATLAEMLAEKRPRSVSEATTWLVHKAPKLFVSKTGEPMAERTLRRLLPAVIGSGLEVTRSGKPTRIVLQGDGSGNGARYQIDFSDTAPPARRRVTVKGRKRWKKKR